MQSQTGLHRDSDNDHVLQYAPTSSTRRSFFSLGSIRTRSDEPAAHQQNLLGITTLYKPASETDVADLIFVHGLRGGSYKTWTKSNDASLFWPKEWLPQDEAFERSRIHSFGYDSNWGKRSTLRILDFSRALLGAMMDYPSIPHDSKAPLVLVGHSMGGLVIKRAFILAKQRDDLHSLTDRIKAMVFLATPRRGADLASVFSKILNLTRGARPFVEDLHRNSLATESINDEFPFFCQDLRIISFYDTLPTIGKSLIMERDQVTLGYTNERRQYLNINHREVCKYGSKTDENYCTVRNALAGILIDFQESSEMSRQKTKEGKSRQLEALLAAYDTPEDDLLTADSVRMGGSCEWLTKKQSVLDWLACSGLQTYWVVGKMVAGKTVLAIKVISAYLGLLKFLSMEY